MQIPCQILDIKQWEDLIPINLFLLYYNHVAVSICLILFNWKIELVYHWLFSGNTWKQGGQSFVFKYAYILLVIFLNVEMILAEQAEIKFFFSV